MRLITVAVLCAATSALAIPKTTHARLVEKYEEPNTWANRSNFFVGARASIAIPQGAVGIAPLAGIELGIAPDYGFGISMNMIWMERSPGAPMFGIQPGNYGFGASANFRYYFQTVGPLTLYPAFSIGFLAGPDPMGKNQVLPMINPGFGAKVRAGPFYVSFDFGLSAFTIPFVGASVGYEGNRREERAEAWANDQEEKAREAEEERLQREKEQQGKLIEEAPPAAAAPAMEPVTAAVLSTASATPPSPVARPAPKPQPEDEFASLPRAAR